MAEISDKIKKIVLKSDVLWRALELIKHFVATNTVLPILDDAFFFNVSQKQIEIIAFNLVNFVKISFPVQTSDEFCGILQFSRLYKLLEPEILPPQVITISLNTENYLLEVDYQRGKIKSGSKNCNDYPNLTYPDKKTSLGLIDLEKMREKLKALPISQSYEKYKLLVSRSLLELIPLPPNIGRKLPQKGIFEAYVSEDYLVLEGLADNFYSLEAYYKKSSIGRRDNNITQKELEEAQKSKNSNYMLLVEDILQKQESIPLSKEKNTKKTPKEQPKTPKIEQIETTKPKERPPIIEEEKPKKTKKQPKEQPKEQPKTPKQDKKTLASIQKRIENLQIILSLNKKDTKIKQRIKDLELINTL